MGVIFDEVLTEVTVAEQPAREERAETPDVSLPGADAERRRWQQEQRDYWRRRARLEAD